MARESFTITDQMSQTKIDWHMSRDDDGTLHLNGYDTTIYNENGTIDVESSYTAREDIFLSSEGARFIYMAADLDFDTVSSIQHQYDTDGQEFRVYGEMNGKDYERLTIRLDDGSVCRVDIMDNVCTVERFDENGNLTDRLEAKRDPESGEIVITESFGDVNGISIEDRPSDDHPQPGFQITIENRDPDNPDKVESTVTVQQGVREWSFEQQDWEKLTHINIKTDDREVSYTTVEGVDTVDLYKTEVSTREAVIEINGTEYKASIETRTETARNMAEGTTQSGANLEVSSPLKLSTIVVDAPVDKTITVDDKTVERVCVVLDGDEMPPYVEIHYDDGSREYIEFEDLHSVRGMEQYGDIIEAATRCIEDVQECKYEDLEQKLEDQADSDTDRTDSGDGNDDVDPVD